MPVKKKIATPASIEPRILFIRAQRVMIDADLAALYGVETRALNQAVRRNLERFPEDFMFQLSATEFENWRSQIVISNSQAKMGLRKPPLAFTEQGVAMLSSVLRSPRAIAANVAIMRAFVRMRETLAAHKELAKTLVLLEARIDNQDDTIAEIFQTIRDLMDKTAVITSPPPDTKPKRKIGFV
jgi:hypothetical protein